MRERVAMLNGEMTAGATEDGGYEIAVFLPVPPSDLPEPRETAGSTADAPGDADTVVIERDGGA